MGSGFESQGAHFKENPADSSESAGFLRSLNFIDFGLRYRYFPLLLQGTRPRFASDTLMSRRGNIYTSAHLWFRGSRNPAGSLGCVVVQYVRPVPSELWRGGCRGLVCCVVARCLGGEMFAVVLCAPRA